MEILWAFVGNSEAKTKGVYKMNHCRLTRQGHIARTLSLFLCVYHFYLLFKRGYDILVCCMLETRGNKTETTQHNECCGKKMPFEKFTRHNLALEQSSYADIPLRTIFIVK